MKAKHGVESMSKEQQFNLLISFWDSADSKRQQELFFCLRKNIDNPYLRRIVLFYDGKSNPQEFHHPKISVVPCQEFPTYGLFFDYAARHLVGELIIVANTDIFFDHTLGLLDGYNFDNTVLALTRYDMDQQKDHKGRISKRFSWSQDSWIFLSPLKKFSDDIHLGYLGCENLIAYEMKSAGLQVRNHSADIKTWHVHENRKIIEDEYHDPKSYHSYVFDRNYNMLHGAFVPCEPLRKWTVHTVYLPSQEKLYRECSLPTVKDDFKVDALLVDPCLQDQFSGAEESWILDIYKTRRICEVLKNLEDDALFIYFDPGVQFFTHLQDELREILSQNIASIFFMQGAYSTIHQRPCCLTEFLVCRANDYSREFWSKTYEKMMIQKISLQQALMDIYQKPMNSEPENFAFLPKSFFERERASLSLILKETKPVLSVITPVLNGGQYIESCILNVIEQGISCRIEHIIYDGGSSDETIAIIKEYAQLYSHIRFISVPGTNQSKAMNEAIKIARGEIIAILNVDDFYNPGTLREVIKEFRLLASGSFLIGNLHVFNRYGQVERVNKPAHLNLNDILWQRVDPPCNPSAYFYHKSLHDTLGVYDEGDDYSMDLDFVFRVLQNQDLIYRDRNWGNFRLLPGAKTFEKNRSGESSSIWANLSRRYRRDIIPRCRQILPGTLWGITAYYNPDGNKNRYENYLKFRAASQRQGLRLIAVELALDDRPFELKEKDAEILVQVRGGEQNIVWQKEALLNIALKRLPDDCDKVVWLDNDILFKNEAWVKETSRLLENYKVIQPYSVALYLSEGQDEEDPLKIPYGFGEGRQMYGLAYRVAVYGQAAVSYSFEKSGHMGFGWAFRRDCIEELTFLDSAIFHNGDSLMAFSFYNSWVRFRHPSNSWLPPESAIWCRKAGGLVGGSVYYCPGVAMHLWHGALASRIYEAKRYEHFYQLQKTSGFDFNRDLSKNKDGLWEWRETSGGVFREELKSFYVKKR